MSELTREHVQEIVRAENQSLSKTMETLALEVGNMAKAVNKIAIQSSVNEERFNAVNGRIDGITKTLNDTNTRLVSIGTEILPDLEAKVAVVSFSANKIWQLALTISAPLAVVAWTLIERQNTIQLSHLKIMVQAIEKMGKIALGT